MVRRFFSLLSLLSIAAVLLAYTGPGNRTVTQTVETCHALILECSWRADKGWRWRQTGNDWMCANESKPWLAWPKLTGQSCAAGNEGEERWTQDVTSDTTTVTYLPVPVSGIVTCGLPGSAGWCRGGLTQTLTASEPIPGYVVRFFENAGGTICDPADAASVTCSRSISQQGMNSDSFWAVSSFGDTSLMQPYSWKLDSVLPTNLTSFPAPDGLNGWYVSPVSGSISGSDATSGIDLAGYRWRVDGGAWQNGTPIAIPSDGTHTVNTETRDIAGNTASQVVIIRIDQTPPSVTIPTFPDGHNGWYVTHPTITLTATDATSGIATTAFDGFGSDSVTLPDGVHPLTAIAQDMAGNTWAISETVRVDTQPPVLAPAMTAPAASGWHTSVVTAAANASDSISGLALVEYRVNTGAWQPGSSVTIAEDGEYVIQFRAADNAGNQVTGAPMQFRLDQTKPASAFSNPPEGSTTKISGAFTFSGASADTLSGLDLAEISLDNGATWQPLTLAAGNWSYTWDTRLVRDGTYTILARAVDRAGNRENTARVQVIAANAPPRIELQDSWWLWETGRVRVRIGDIPIQSVTIQISCAPHHQDVTLRYIEDTLPSEIQWDRRCGEGAYAAESGDYPVTATVCDTWGRCHTANGVIKVPIIAPPVPTLTPMPASETLIQPPAPSPSVTQVASVQAAAPVTNEPAPMITKFGLPGATLRWWHISALAGLLAFAAVSLSDPRPRALFRLAESVRKIGESR
jgi:hypothetical protein